ncbi:chitinase [Solirubrobacter taibaiensis]|nr:chitinase [Solirubrobacter taibaiensis]
MNRFLIAALAALLVGAVPADAAPHTVTSTVTLSAPTLTVQLASGSRVKTVRGGTVKVRGKVATITARGKTVRLVTTGAAPKAFRAGATKCSVKRTGRRKLAVTCPATRPSGGGAPGGVPGEGGNGAAPGGNHGAMPGTGGGDTPGTGDPAPGGGPPATRTVFPFAPYVDFSAGIPPNLIDLRAQSGAKHISLGFVVADPACAPSWGGWEAYPATGAGAYRQAHVAAFKAAGGDVVVSFGGANGKELAFCHTEASALADAYEAALAAYGATHADFDIEGGAIKDDDKNALRAEAIALLQAEHPELAVTFTVPTLVDGMDAHGKALITKTVSKGVDLDAVNIMAMELNVTNSAGKLGTYAIEAAKGLYAQLTELYPTLTAAQRWHKVGVTPMLGVNYDTAQVFTPADARTLTDWAIQRQIGMLAMWQLGTDKACATLQPFPQLTCSGTTQTPFEFAKTFGTFAG